MVKPAPQFVDYVVDMLEPLGTVSKGRFFSGVELRIDGTQIAMLNGETLYLRVSPAMRATLEGQGGQAFSYAKRDRRVEVGRYVSVPEDALDDDERLQDLVRAALATLDEK
ncbi:MAG: TfoX/Sxy family protein [Bauldia litoralis]